MRTPEQLRAMTKEQVIAYALWLIAQVAHKEAIIRRQSAELAELRERVRQATEIPY